MTHDLLIDLKRASDEEKDASKGENKEDRHEASIYPKILAVVTLLNGHAHPVRQVPACTSSIKRKKTMTSKKKAIAKYE